MRDSSQSSTSKNTDRKIEQIVQEAQSLKGNKGLSCKYPGLDNFIGFPTTLPIPQSIPEEEHIFYHEERVLRRLGIRCRRLGGKIVIEN